MVNGNGAFGVDILTLFLSRLLGMFIVCLRAWGYTLIASASTIYTGYWSSQCTGILARSAGSVKPPRHLRAGEGALLEVPPKSEKARFGFIPIQN